MEDTKTPAVTGASDALATSILYHNLEPAPISVDGSVFTPGTITSGAPDDSPNMDPVCLLESAASTGSAFLPPPTVEKAISVDVSTAPTVEQLTQKEMLLAIASAIELWHDSDGEEYATLERGGGSFNAKLRSKEFRDWLCWLSYQAFRCTPSAQVLEDVIRTLGGKARYASPEFEPHVRVAGDENMSYLHLGDQAGTIYCINASGVEVMPKKVEGVEGLEGLEASFPTFKFLVKPGMKRLPVPKLPVDKSALRSALSDLRAFCNLKDEDEWLLFLVALLSSFRPRGPFVVIIVVGEQGSAKSTLCKIFRRLVDPSKAMLRSAPREERDLWIAAQNGWIIIFDNVSGLPAAMSDSICRLATGGGNSYRTLYENDGETLFQAQRLVILNTIDDLSLRSDLVDRSIRLNCQRIDDSNRLPESDFWTGFEQYEGEFLGALLSLLSMTMGILPSTRLERSPRMADFAKFGVAVEKALDLPDGSFLRAYGKNRNSLAAEALNSQLTDLVMGLYFPLESTASGLWQILHEKASFQPGELPRWFPSTPQQLSSRLRRLAPFFRQNGIEIEFKHSGTSKIVMTRLTLEGS